AVVRRGRACDGSGASAALAAHMADGALCGAAGSGRPLPALCVVRRLAVVGKRLCDRHVDPARAHGPRLSRHLGARHGASIPLALRDRGSAVVAAAWPGYAIVTAASREPTSMKRLTRILLPAAALVMSAAMARADDLNVAMVGPVTGQYAAFGEQMRRGAEMAVQDINAKGGVLGRKLKLAVGDDACDPKQAVNVANQMANNGVH